MQSLQRLHVSKFRRLKGSDDQHTVCRNNKGEVHDATKVDFIVLEDIDSVVNFYVATSCRLSLLRYEPGPDIDSFVFTQPLCLLGKIGNNEEGNKGDNASEDAFQNENPTPSVEASEGIQISYSSSKQTTESSCKCGGAEECGVSFLRFGAFVPHSY